MAEPRLENVDFVCSPKGCIGINPSVVMRYALLKAEVNRFASLVGFEPLVGLLIDRKAAEAAHASARYAISKGAPPELQLVASRAAQIDLAEFPEALRSAFFAAGNQKSAPPPFLTVPAKRVFSGWPAFVATTVLSTAAVGGVFFATR